MMGKRQSERKLFYVGFDLDARVRAENPLRRIAEAIDFCFVREEVSGLYGWKGNVSVDPEVILKMMFLLFYDDVASERELMRIIPERLDYLWFLGYSLDDEIPNHSVLSKARRRWGPEAFERFFVETVRQCVEAGLVEGTKIHVDGSLVDAEASKNSVVKGPPELIASLREAYRREEGKLDDRQDDEDRPGGHAGRPYYDAKNDRMMSTTDPDAAVVRQGKGSSRPRHKHHRAVDDAHGVVTAVETTRGDVKENGEMMSLVQQHERNTEREVETVVADSQYGTVENFRACQERGIRSHMADLREGQGGKGSRRGIYDESVFVYDAEADTYRCPAGRTLTRRKHRTERRAYEYSAGAKTCAACDLRTKCTRSKTGGRTIKRHEEQEAIDQARAQSHSAAAKRDRRRRKHLMEGSFADAANNHGFKRARWRRRWRQRIQDLLIAAIQNIRMLLTHASRRRRAAIEALGLPEGLAPAFFRSVQGLRSPADRLCPTI
jgi:transposase